MCLNSKTKSVHIANQEIDVDEKDGIILHVFK